jgi:hypothetical protein
VGGWEGVGGFEGGVGECGGGFGVLGGCGVVGSDAPVFDGCEFDTRALEAGAGPFAPSAVTPSRVATLSEEEFVVWVADSLCAESDALGSPVADDFTELCPVSGIGVATRDVFAALLGERAQR